MMGAIFQSILVVCVGNICRSPVAERVLASKLAYLGSKVSVSSAGIAALEGHAADDDAASVASAHGHSLAGHEARQFTHELGIAHALILVMEKGHKHEIMRTAPDLSGRIMLFDHWTNSIGIADPYRRSRLFHEEVFAQIEAAASAWAGKLHQ